MLSLAGGANGSFAFASDGLDVTPDVRCEARSTEGDHLAYEPLSLQEAGGLPDWPAGEVWTSTSTAGTPWTC
ncbi:hypothetical protein Slala04_21910 [Streptomyces lavendulae subsp. lavendulae]|nr:hypothetical protein Slala04_21910 [Streptomyces lavendulae subsp. lavendulae]